MKSSEIIFSSNVEDFLFKDNQELKKLITNTSKMDEEFAIYLERN